MQVNRNKPNIPLKTLQQQQQQNTRPAPKNSPCPFCKQNRKTKQNQIKSGLEHLRPFGKKLSPFYSTFFGHFRQHHWTWQKEKSLWRAHNIYTMHTTAAARRVQVPHRGHQPAPTKAKALPPMTNRCHAADTRQLSLQAPQCRTSVSKHRTARRKPRLTQD